MGTKPYVGQVYDSISEEALKGSLNGQVCCVVGAGRGIGRVIAHSFAAAGAKVSIASRNESEVREVAEELKQKYGTKTHYAVADTTKIEDLRALIDDTEKQLGPIDVLVANSAMSYLYALFEDAFDMDKWWQ